ncbi:MAG: hypothetical protein AAB947_01630 [Patescibacteria group bacterium]
MPRTITEWIMVILIMIAILSDLNAMSYEDAFLEYFLFIGILGIIIVIGVISYTEVPAQPPSVAMPTFLSWRYDVLLGEGPAFVLPEIELLIVRDYLPIVLPFTFDGVRCLLQRKDTGEKISGGLTTVKGSLTYVPDISSAQRFRSFLNKGGNPIISTQLLAMAGQAVREEGGNMTWEEFTFAKSELSVKLITMLTGLEPYSQSPVDIKKFLKEALVNGVADIKDLGIKITRLNIEEVELEGDLKRDAEKAARELVQMPAEVADTNTGLNLVKEFLRAMKITDTDLEIMSIKERVSLIAQIAEWVRIDRGRTDEIVVRSSGNPLADAAALLRPQSAGTRDDK